MENIVRCLAHYAFPACSLIDIRSPGAFIAGEVTVVVVFTYTHAISIHATPEYYSNERGG